MIGTLDLENPKLENPKLENPAMNERKIKFRDDLEFVISSKSIDVSGKDLKEIPESIDISSLESLNLGRNSLTTLNKNSFERFVQLKILDVSDNPKLWNLDEMIFNGVYWFKWAKNLQELSLARTNIVHLPIHPGYCPKLEYISTLIRRKSVAQTRH